MKSDLRTVIDINALISAALLPSSVSRRAFDVAAAGTLLASESAVTELSDVLRRPKFDRYVSQGKRLEFIAAFVAAAELVTITHTIHECRDSSDDKFLELAISGHATHMMTGDLDLLSLHPFRGIPILTPAAYLDSVPKHS